MKLGNVVVGGSQCNVYVEMRSSHERGRGEGEGTQILSET